MERLGDQPVSEGLSYPGVPLELGVELSARELVGLIEYEIAQFDASSQVSATEDQVIAPHYNPRPANRSRRYIPRSDSEKLTRMPHRHTGEEKKDAEQRRVERVTYVKNVMGHDGPVEKRVPVVPAWKLRVPSIRANYLVDDSNGSALDELDTTADQALDPSQPPKVWQFPPEGNNTGSVIRWKLSSHPTFLPEDPTVYVEILERAGLLDPVVESLPDAARQKGLSVVYLSQVEPRPLVPSAALAFPSGRQASGTEKPGVSSIKDALGKERIYKLLREQVADVLLNLTPKERKAVQLDRGLIDDKARSEEEIAQQLGCSVKEAARLVSSGLRKLRHPHRHTNAPSPYLD